MILIRTSKIPVNVGCVYFLGAFLSTAFVKWTVYNQESTSYHFDLTSISTATLKQHSIFQSFRILSLQSPK